MHLHCGGWQISVRSAAACAPPMNCSLCAPASVSGVDELLQEVGTQRFGEQGGLYLIHSPKRMFYVFIVTEKHPHITLADTLSTLKDGGMLEISKSRCLARVCCIRCGGSKRQSSYPVTFFLPFLGVFECRSKKSCSTSPYINMSCTHSFDVSALSFGPSCLFFYGAAFMLIVCTC